VLGWARDRGTRPAEYDRHGQVEVTTTMTMLQLIDEAAKSATVLYTWTIALSAITALTAPEPDQRQNARKVLALLLGGTSPD
jgi:hypothetical protein